MGLVVKVQCLGFRAEGLGFRGGVKVWSMWSRKTLILGPLLEVVKGNPVPRDVCRPG